MEYMDKSPRVEVGSNTSTVALRIVEGDEKGTRCWDTLLLGAYKYRNVVPQVWGLDARLTTLLCKKNCCKIQRNENRTKSGRIF
jgi:hypothetical protein